MHNCTSVYRFTNCSQIRETAGAWILEDMAFKKVMFLVEKHRRDVWLDHSGDIWFYDGAKGKWRLLICGVGQPVLLSESTGDFAPTSEYGPFTRLWKTPR